MKEVWIFSGTLHYGELWGANNGSSWGGTQTFAGHLTAHPLFRFALMECFQQAYMMYYPKNR